MNANDLNNSNNSNIHKQLEPEDLVRYIGTLEAIYNHLVSSLVIANDKATREKYDFAKWHIRKLRRKYSVRLKDTLGLDDSAYCIVCKHLPYALILAGELDEDAEILYAILASLTDGKIEACGACRKDVNSVNATADNSDDSDNSLGGNNELTRQEN